jgi:hypothetical protein
VGDLPKCERLLGEMVMKYVPATSKLIVEEEEEEQPIDVTAKEEVVEVVNDNLEVVTEKVVVIVPNEGEVEEAKEKVEEKVVLIQ